MNRLLLLVSGEYVFLVFLPLVFPPSPNYSNFMNWHSKIIDICHDKVPQNELFEYNSNKRGHKKMLKKPLIYETTPLTKNYQKSGQMEKQKKFLKKIRAPRRSDFNIRSVLFYIKISYKNILYYKNSRHFILFQLYHLLLIKNCRKICKLTLRPGCVAGFGSSVYNVDRTIQDGT